MSFSSIVYSYAVTNPGYLYAMIVVSCVVERILGIIIIAAIGSFGKVASVKIGDVTVVSEAP
jgi:hypothetical protein